MDKKDCKYNMEDCEQDCSNCHIHTKEECVIAKDRYPKYKDGRCLLEVILDVSIIVLMLAVVKVVVYNI